MTKVCEEVRATCNDFRSIVNKNFIFTTVNKLTNFEGLMLNLKLSIYFTNQVGALNSTQPITI